MSQLIITRRLFYKSEKDYKKYFNRDADKAIKRMNADGFMRILDSECLLRSFNNDMVCVTIDFSKNE